MSNANPHARFHAIYQGLSAASREQVNAAFWSAVRDVAIAHYKMLYTNALPKALTAIENGAAPETLDTLIHKQLESLTPKLLPRMETLVRLTLEPIIQRACYATGNKPLSASECDHLQKGLYVQMAIINQSLMVDLFRATAKYGLPPQSEVEQFIDENICMLQMEPQISEHVGKGLLHSVTSTHSAWRERTRATTEEMLQKLLKRGPQTPGDSQDPKPLQR